MAGAFKKTFVYGRLRSLGTRDRELIVGCWWIGLTIVSIVVNRIVDNGQRTRIVAAADSSWDKHAARTFKQNRTQVASDFRIALDAEITYVKLRKGNDAMNQVQARAEERVVQVVRKTVLGPPWTTKVPVVSSRPSNYRSRFSPP